MVLWRRSPYTYNICMSMFFNRFVCANGARSSTMLEKHRAKVVVGTSWTRLIGSHSQMTKATLKIFLEGKATLKMVYGKGMRANLGPWVYGWVVNPFSLVGFLLGLSSSLGLLCFSLSHWLDIPIFFPLLNCWWQILVTWSWSTSSVLSQDKWGLR